MICPCAGDEALRQQLEACLGKQYCAPGTVAGLGRTLLPYPVRVPDNMVYMSKGWAVVKV